MSDDECPHGIEDPAWCSICKHGPTRPEPVAVSHVFVARFPGQCRGCNLPIREGARIARLTDDSYVHESCAGEALGYDRERGKS